MCASALAFSRIDPQVEVTFRPGHDGEFCVQHLAVGYGKVTQRVSTSTYVVTLTTSLDLDRAIHRMTARSSVLSVRLLPPQLPQSKLKSMGVTELAEVIADYKELYEEYEERNPELKSEEEEAGEEMDEVPGLDFLEGYLQHKRNRAYPFEEIDFSGFQEVVRERLNDQAEPRESSVFDRLGVKAPNFGNIKPTSSSVWEFLGPQNLDPPYRIYYGLGPLSGRVNAIAVHPTQSNTVYLGATQGGVWKTTDGGTNWLPLSDSWPMLGVSSLAIHPTNPDLVLAGTGDFHGFDIAGMGVMRSTDGGNTWTNVGSAMGTSRVSEIVFDPSNPQIVIATTGRSGSGKIWRSTDAGQTWSPASGTTADWSDVTIGIPDGNGVRTYLAVAGGSTPRIYRSTDQGASWTSLSVPTSGSQNPLSIAASKLASGTAYLLATSNRTVFKTTDSGQTWTDVTNNFPNGSNNYNWSQGWYDYHINTSVAGTQDAIFVGLIDIVMSRDGGATWRNIGGSNYTATYNGTAITHNDQHSFAVDPQDANRVWVGNDGGIFRAVYNPNNDSITWSRLSATLGITQFYTLAVHPNNPDYLKGGTQDNATPHSLGDLAHWANPGAGDGAGCAINPQNTDIQYNSSQYQNIYRTLNEYNSSSTISVGWSGQQVPFIGRLWLDPNNPRYLYANTNYLNRWDENTDTWSMKLGGSALGSMVNAFAAAEGDSNRLYTGSNNGLVYMSTNFGSSFTRIDRQGLSGGLPNRSVSSISVNPDDKNDVIVGFYGTGAGTLWRCTNPTAASPTWTRIDGSGSNDLPNVPLSCIARDPSDPVNTIYVGTDVGVFKTTDGGNNWEDITQSKGLPNVEVSQLIFNETTGYLTASTFGRGMWRLNVNETQLAVSQLTIAPSQIIGGDDAMGTVLLDGAAPAGGTVVNLTSNDPSLVVPSTVTVPEGSTSANFVITTSEVASDTPATVTATLGTSSVDTTATVLFTYWLEVAKREHGNYLGLSGNNFSLKLSDDQRLEWAINNQAKRETDVTLAYLVPTSNLDWLRFEGELAATNAQVIYKVRLMKNGLFTLLHTGTATLQDGHFSFEIPTGLAPYIFLNEQIVVAIEFHNETSGDFPFTVKIDQIKIRVR